MTVEFIYDADCPHVEAARANLLQAFSATRVAAKWTEWDRSSLDSPTHVRRYGSPTVLVNGRDVAGESSNEAVNCCRLYAATNGSHTGAPPAELIQSALLTAEDLNRSGWKRTLAVAPGIGVALLPKLTCPMCWPAYAGLLSALGLSILLSTRYLFLLTALFLSVSVGALCYRAQKRRGYAPTILGLGAAAITLMGKFALDSTAAMYAGLALLGAASLWNSWPRRVISGCSQCAPAGSTFGKRSERRD
ncbi:MAG: hypothetical protein M3Z32_10205 [Acidobacteriota bacterium]|nr:hypothetical protein [Acidobacteriota bacterium]